MTNVCKLSCDREMSWRNGCFLGHLDYFFGTYVLISSLFARLAYPYSIVSALVVAPNLFLIPYLVGSGILCIFNRTLNRESISFRFLIALFVGAVFLHTFFVLTEFFGYRIDMFIFDLVIVGLVTVGFLMDVLCRMSTIKRKVGFPRDNVRKMGLDAGIVGSIFATVAIAVLAFYVPKIRLPFPLVSFDGAVGHEAIRPVTRLLNDGVLDVFKVRGLPVILQAVVCSLSNVPILNLSWAAPLSTSLVFSFSMFSLTYSITRKKIVALASVLLAVFINSSGLFFDVTYFIFRYSTIITAVFPLVIQEVYLHFVKVKNGNEKTKHITILFIGTVFLIGAFYVFELLQPPFLTSFFMVNEFLRPFLSIIFLSFVFVYISKIENNQPVKNLIILISLFTVFALSIDILRPALNVIFLYFFLFLLTQISFKSIKSWHRKCIKLNIPWSNRINGLRFFAFIMVLWNILCLKGYVSLSDFSPVARWSIYTSTKSQSLIASNSMEVLVVFFVMCTILLFSRKKGEFAFSFLSIVSLFVIFLPVAEFNYFAHNISNIFMGFVIAVGLYIIAEQLSKWVKLSRIRLRNPIKFSAFSLMVLIIVSPILNASITRFTWIPEGANYRTLLTDYESKSIEEYISKLPEDTRIISDPFTMIYISSLTNHIGLVDVGMAPFTEQYKSRNDIITIWNDIFHGNSSLEIYSSIMKFKDTVPHDEERFIQRIRRPIDLSGFIVIIGGRTAWWLDHNDPFGWYPLFPPTYNVTTLHVIRFFDPRYFTLSYKIDSKIYIFSVEKSEVPLSPVNENNVLYLPLNQIINSKVEDKSKYKNYGTVYGATLVNGKVDKALSFDGLDDYVEVPDSPSLHIAPPFTVELWVCPTLNKAWMPMYKGLWTADNSWYIYGDDTSRLVVRFWYGGTPYNVEYSYDFLNKWTHVVAVYQEAEKPILLYLNGVLVATGTTIPSGASHNTQKLCIGRYDKTLYYIQGFIDEARIYNRALNPEEIYNNYLYGCLA